MRQILNNIQPGKVSDELRRRGIPWGQRLRVVVESMDMEEPSITGINAAGGASTGWPKSLICITMTTWSSVSARDRNSIWGDRSNRFPLLPT